MTTQTETDAIAILRLLGRHQLRRKGDDTEEYEYVTSGIKWSHATIHVLGGYDAKQDRTLTALRWLEKHRLVYHHNRQWWINEEGERVNRDAREHPELLVSDTAFKNEALTGMTSCGNQSKIENAVLPCPSKQPRTMREQRSVSDDTAAVKHAARAFDIDEETAMAYIMSGKIRVCRCGGKEHLGMFHDGQFRCIVCRKKVRK